MKKERKMKKGKRLLSCILVLGLIWGFAGCGGSDTDSASSSSSSTASEQKVTYTKYKVRKLINDLDKNALKAEEKYNEKYVSLTGRLNNIDSSGDYISIGSDEWDFIGVQCYVQDDKQLDKIKKMSIGDTIIVKGQITDVGEIMGYSLDIDSIRKAK